MEKVKSICGTVINFVKAHYKIFVVILVALVVACVALNLFGGKAKAKRTVKSYVSAVSSGKEEKIKKLMDAKGFLAWVECDGKASKFVEEYKDIDDDDDKIEMYEDTIDSIAESAAKQKDKYDKYSIKVKKITEVKNEGKGLYKVKARVEKTTVDDGDKDTDNDKMIFYIYKGKIVNFESDD